MNQPRTQITRRPTAPFTLAAGALAVSLMLTACGGGDPVVPDTTAPTVAITDNVAGTATAAVTFTFTFSEDVGTSFTAEDVTVAGGAAGAFTKVSGTVFTLVVTPTASAAGNITVSVAAAKFKDLALNDNVAQVSVTQAYDTTTPAASGTVLASFDETTPLAFSGFDGAQSSSIAAGPAGGTGMAAKIIRLGGEVWAGAKVNVGVMPLTATANTISARVYSAVAGVPMVLKLENATDAGINTGDMQAKEAVVVGWQTLTWVIPADKLAASYSWVVMLPNLNTKASLDPGETYYFDDIKLLGTAPPPPVAATVLASFDETTPLAFSGFDGAQSSSIAAGPAGGTGLAAKIIRLGGEVWAGAKVNVGVMPLSATANTISARVYSAVAGVPMVLKLENATDAGINTGDMQAKEAVVAGWQTLTWVIPADKLAASYSWVVMLPNLNTKASLDPGETYYFDDIKLLGATAPPPPPAATVLASFDETTPLAFSGFDGAQTSSIAAGPAGGTGLAAKIIRLGGEVWAGAKVNVGVMPLSATANTISARVYSAVAGVPMVLKLENATDAGINTGDMPAKEAVVVGWQTLTWTVPAGKVGGSYSWVVMLPNLNTKASLDPGETYYFDDIKLLGATGGTGGGTGGGTPGVGLGAGGPQTLTIAAADVKTGDGGNTMFVAGEGLFSVNYVGSAEAFAPFNLAAWPNAKTANFGSITGISGGDIGYFQDDVNLSNSTQKVDEGGWVAGTALGPNGVPSFFRYFVLKGAVSTAAYMGVYANAPNNGTLNVSSFSKIKMKVWGPGPMFERTNFTPVLQVTLTGPKVDGCTTGSGGSEITQNLTANLKNGAGGFYTMPLSGFTVKGLCGTDTGAANVLAKLARVVVTVPGTSFNYTNLDGGNYATGVNLGPVGFTNN